MGLHEIKLPEQCWHVDFGWISLTLNIKWIQDSGLLIVHLWPMALSHMWVIGSVLASLCSVMCLFWSLASDGGWGSSRHPLLRVIPQTPSSTGFALLRVRQISGHHSAYFLWGLSRHLPLMLISPSDPNSLLPMIDVVTYSRSWFCQDRVVVFLMRVLAFLIPTDSWLRTTSVDEHTC